HQLDLRSGAPRMRSNQNVRVELQLPEYACPGRNHRAVVRKLEVGWIIGVELIGRKAAQDHWLTGIETVRSVKRRQRLRLLPCCAVERVSMRITDHVQLRRWKSHAQVLVALRQAVERDRRRTASIQDPWIGRRNTQRFRKQSHLCRQPQQIQPLKVEAPLWPKPAQYPGCNSLCPVNSTVLVELRRLQRIRQGKRQNDRWDASSS